MDLASSKATEDVDFASSVGGCQQSQVTEFIAESTDEQRLYKVLIQRVLVSNERTCLWISFFEGSAGDRICKRTTGLKGILPSAFIW